MLISKPFTRFLLLMFLANILIYWVSPAIYARYLFMFIPLFSGMVFYVYTEGKKRLFTENYILHPMLALMIVAIIVLIAMSPWFANISIYKHFWLKYAVFLVLAFIPGFLYLRHKLNPILPLFVLLLVMRITFNFFVLPDRLNSGRDLYQKNGALVAGELSKGKEVYLLHDTRIKHISSYYYMVASGKPLRRWKDEPLAGKTFIIEKEKGYLYPPHKTLFIFETEVYNIKLALIEFTGEE
jgi:hypothetical protein